MLNLCIVKFRVLILVLMCYGQLTEPTGEREEAKTTSLTTVTQLHNVTTTTEKVITTDEKEPTTKPPPESTSKNNEIGSNLKLTKSSGILDKIHESIAFHFDDSEILDSEFGSFNKSIEKMQTMETQNLGLKHHYFRLLSAVWEIVKDFSKEKPLEDLFTKVGRYFLLVGYLPPHYRSAEKQIFLDFVSLFNGVASILRARTASSFREILEPRFGTLFVGQHILRSAFDDATSTFKAYANFLWACRSTEPTPTDFEILIDGNGVLWSRSPFEVTLESDIKGYFQGNGSNNITTQVLDGYYQFWISKRMLLLRTLAVLSRSNSSLKVTQNQIETHLYEMENRMRTLLKPLRFYIPQVMGVLADYFQNSSASNVEIENFLDFLFPETISVKRDFAWDFFRIRNVEHGLYLCTDKSFPDTKWVFASERVECIFYINDGKLLAYQQNNTEATGQLEYDADKKLFLFVKRAESESKNSRKVLMAFVEETGNVVLLFDAATDTAKNRLQPLTIQQKHAHFELPHSGAQSYFSFNLEPVGSDLILLGRNTSSNGTCGAVTYNDVTLDVTDKNDILETWNYVRSSELCCSMCEERHNCLVWSWKHDIERCYIMKQVKKFTAKTGWITGIPGKNSAIAIHNSISFYGKKLNTTSNTSLSSCKASCLPRGDEKNCSAFVFDDAESQCHTYSSVNQNIIKLNKTALAGQIVTVASFLSLENAPLSSGCAKDPGNLSCKILEHNTPQQCFIYCAEIEPKQSVAISKHLTSDGYCPSSKFHMRSIIWCKNVFLAVQGDKCCCNQMSQFHLFKHSISGKDCELPCTGDADYMCGSAAKYHQRFNIHKRGPAYLHFIGCLSLNQEIQKHLKCIDIAEGTLQSCSTVFYLWTDSYYTSLQLANDLWDQSIYLGGTVKKSMSAGLPAPLVDKKGPVAAKMERGDAVFLHTSKATLCLWKDNGPCPMLYTTPDVVDEREIVEKRLKGDEIRKNGGQVTAMISSPKIFVRYNLGMLGVDLNDQLTASCIRHRKSFKWYNSIGDAMFNMAIVNTGIILRDGIASHARLRLPIKRARSLIVEDLLVLAKTVRGIPPSISTTTTQTTSSSPKELRFDFSPTNKHMPGHVQKAQRCLIHSRSEKGRKRTNYICKTCNVPLCIVPCFEKYHTG